MSEQTNKKKNFDKTPFGLIKKNFKGIYYFQVLFKLTIVLILFPLLDFIKDQIMTVNHTSSVTMANFYTVAKNPLTWLILIVIIFVVTLFVCLEDFAQASLLHASWTDKKHITAREAFDSGVDTAVRCLIPSNWPIIIYVLLICPFSSLLDTSSITKYVRLPGFVIENFTKYPVYGAAYTAATVVLAFLALRLSYVIYAMYLEKVSFLKACKISWNMTKGKRMFSLLFAIIGYTLVMLIIMFVILVCIPLIAMLAVMWIEPGIDPTSYVNESFFYALVLPAALLVGMIMSPVTQAVIASRYFRCRTEEGMEIPAYDRHQSHLLKKPWIRVAWAALCIVVIYFSVPKTWRQFKWIFNGNSDEVLIMAHRGNSADAPENTIPAFEAAYEAGATAVELDVQMTKDGKIIVMHDDNTKRTTGVDHNIWEVTYDEIKDLDNGSFFSEEFAGTKIPTLEEAIQCCKDRMFINIEIKRNGHDDGIGDRVVEIIREYEFQNQCDITSQDYDTLVEIHEKYPDVLLAYTSVLGIGEIKDLDAVDIVSIQETFATFDAVESMHRAGKKVFVWTVNDRDVMDDLIGINVDAILTNDPILGNNVLAEHKGIIDRLMRMRQILSYFS